MQTVEIKGKEYVINKLPVKQAFNIGRRILPLLSAVLGKTDDEVLKQAIKEFAEMSDEQANYCLFGLLSCVKRREAPTVLANIVESSVGDLLFQDLNMVDMMKLAVASAKENFSDFLDSSALISNAEA